MEYSLILLRSYVTFCVQSMAEPEVDFSRVKSLSVGNLTMHCLEAHSLLNPFETVLHLFVIVLKRRGSEMRCYVVRLFDRRLGL